LQTIARYVLRCFERSHLESIVSAALAKDAIRPVTYEGRGVHAVERR